MKNFVAEGSIVPLTAPAGGVVSGQGYVVGAIFSVASAPAAAGAAFQGKTNGVFDLPKDGSGSINFTQGERVFWDNTAKLCKKTAAGYFMVGTAVEVAANAATSVRVKLDGVAVVAV